LGFLGVRQTGPSGGGVARGLLILMATGWQHDSGSGKRIWSFQSVGRNRGTGLQFQEIDREEPKKTA
jgi:hypothetical protein